MFLIRRINQGETVPWGWGDVHYEAWTRRMVVMPMPLNLVVRAFWWAYWGMAIKWLPVKIRKADRRITELESENARLKRDAR